jgi:signal transduction histidine kinase
MKIATVIQRNPLVLLLAVAAAAVMLFISEGSYWRSAGTLDALGTMAAARSSLQDVERGLRDAETSQRSYLLTDRKAYLLPYDEALRDIDTALRFLDRYYADEPESMKIVNQLRSLSDAFLSDLALAIGLRQQGRAMRDVAPGDIGTARIDGIRALGAELLATERTRVAAGRDDIYATLLLSRFGIALLTLMALVALVMYLRQGLALELQEQQQKDLLQAERDRLEIEVGQRTAQLTELAHHLQTAREDERNRLARNLHDELGALLTSAKLDAARIRSRMAGSAPEALERLSHLVGTLDSSIALGRRIIEDLRPSTLSNLGLAATLEILAREFSESSSLQVHCQLQAVKLEASAELVIYRVVQEALTNIGKHAVARQVWITLSTTAQAVEASVRDDGVGFDAAAQRRSTYGLMGMRFRVEANGGTLVLKSTAGQGTLIQVRLPESTGGAA